MSQIAALSWRGAALGIRRAPVGRIAAWAFVGLVVFFAVFDHLTPQDPGAISAAESLAHPSGAHLLGTDQLGRDMLSRILAGARTSLLGPTLVAAGVTVVSSSLAVLAGYFGGRLDAFLSRLIDLFASIPPLMVAIVVAGVTGGGFYVTLLVLVVFGLPPSMRNLRAAVMERAHLPFMEAAVTLGLPTWRILLTHLLPTIVPFVVATFFLTFTYSVVDLSSLSFLGLGVPPGAADWGRMVADNRATMFGNLWATAAPAIAIVALSVSTNLIGEWLHSRHETAGQER